MSASINIVDTTSLYRKKLNESSQQINPMVADVSGKSVLMTRFFRGLRPPPELIDLADLNVSAENVAWFVSLIPYTPSNALFPGLQVSQLLNAKIRQH